MCICRKFLVVAYADVAGDKQWLWYWWRNHQIYHIFPKPILGVTLRRVYVFWKLENVNKSNFRANAGARPTRLNGTGKLGPLDDVPCNLISMKVLFAEARWFEEATFENLQHHQKKPSKLRFVKIIFGINHRLRRKLFDAAARRVWQSMTIKIHDESWYPCSSPHRVVVRAYRGWGWRRVAGRRPIMKQPSSPSHCSLKLALLLKRGSEISEISGEGVEAITPYCRELA